jgi:hypothetical protein
MDAAGLAATEGPPTAQEGFPTVSARYVVRITPADIGARVTVRSRLAAPEGRATTTDTVGVLRAWSDGFLEIERRDGSVTRLAEADVVAGRVIPGDRPRPLWVPGRPAATARSAADRAWRSTVAQAARRLGDPRAVRLDFVLAPGRWVDLDSLVEVAVAGLRDGGTTGLDALVATKRSGPVSGLTVTPTAPAALSAASPPGPTAVSVTSPVKPRDRRSKEALRGQLATAWKDQPLLEGEVWVDLAIATTGALLAVMEPALDTLEPVLGRDPRGQARQEFFPFDDRITWLRIRRTPRPAVTLSLGPVRS